LTNRWTTAHQRGVSPTRVEKRLVGGLRDLAHTPHISLSPHIHITLWTTYRLRNTISRPTPTPLTQSVTPNRTTICQSVDYLSAQWLTSPLPTCGLPLYQPVDYLSTNLWTTSLPTCGLPLYQPVDYLSSQCKANSPNPYIPSNILVYRWTTTLPTCGLPLSQPMDSLSAQWWTTPRPSIAPLLI